MPPTSHGAYLRREEIRPTGSDSATHMRTGLTLLGSTDFGGTNLCHPRTLAGSREFAHTRLTFTSSADFCGTRATLAHTPACPNSDELDLLSFHGFPRIGVDATHTRGLPCILFGSREIALSNSLTHGAKTFRRNRWKVANAPKIVRRCTPIRGD